jgi:tellurite resistance protein
LKLPTLTLDPSVNSPGPAHPDKRTTIAKPLTRPTSVVYHPGMSPVTFEPAEAHEVVRALAAVAAADGAILSREESVLEGFAIAHGIGGHVWLAAPLDELALARAVTPPEKRREVVRLCLEMAHSDREYAASEQQMIARIARALEIGEAELRTLTAETKRPR